MAASTRALTPTTHFSPATVAPNTPTSISSLPQTHPTTSKDSLLPAASIARRSSASPNSHKTALSARLSPQPLTGAAAMADERRAREEESGQTSPNPGAAAINALLHEGMSPAPDAPSATKKMSEPLQKIAKSISIPDPNNPHNGDHPQTSPVSISSFGSIDHTTAVTATASNVATAGPVSVGNQSSGPPARADTVTETPSNRAYTFPPPLPDSDPRQRNMSLPMSGFSQGSAQKSPASKRHKCPYCSTDFTRHHNLKSHLLTHSQEKPYECPTCNARFRRLHDLKRHTKLHTGERPHTCPKCGRRFARGDALARHNKGQGGCAGRRASFDMDDEGRMPGDAMDGLEYSHAQTAEPEGMDEDDDMDDRRRSEPNDKGPGGRQDSYSNHHPSTYPPIGPPGMMRNSGRPPMYPPSGSSTATSSRDPSTNLSPKLPGGSVSSIHFNAGQPSVYSQGSMTESPRPLSPGQPDPRHRPNMDSRSSSLHQAYTQGSTRASGSGLPPPSMSSNAPHLPSLPGLNPSSSERGMRGGSQTGHPPSMLSQQVSGSNPSSMSSHGPSSGGSMREILQNSHAANQGHDIWGLVRELESRMGRMQEEYEGRISRMQDEMNGLKSQLHSQNQNDRR
ncbi:hypothetical protein K402DRAFT_139855 [Aulographum hederae CBS 113979]|uniref:C2H2-type domain-containing protein n=1 Tax=Aulographum hederae CBS 113979 TaxID=1176131 RepID=A0A6G1GUJ0_9PEZI|nr:hypothetical protein K402DRAFT_139855 [Aulographum hederae CBS 113979]